MQVLEISVDGPGGQLPIIDRLHRRLRHSSQVTAAEYSRLAAQAAKDLILNLILLSNGLMFGPNKEQIICFVPFAN